LEVSLLSPEDRRAFRKLWWSAPVRRFQILAIAGAAIGGIGVVSILYSSIAVAPDARTPELTSLLFGTLLLGLVVFVAGLGLRERATRRIALRPCTACQTMNLWRAVYCSKCGAALPASPIH
jgi:hypothetical protein